MKVVLCINDLGRGGAERQLAIIASELHKKGHKVSVLTLWGNYNYKGNINFDLLNANNIECSYLCKDKTKNFIRVWHKLSIYISHNSPDVIYSMLPITNVLVGVYKLLHHSTKVIFGIRIALENNEGFRMSTKLSISIERFLIRYVNLIICNSTLAKKYLIRDGIKNRIEVVQNGVDLGLNYKGKDVREQLFRNYCDSSGKFLFGSIGRVQEQKDYLTLIMATELLSKITDKFIVFIVGRIQVKSYYERLIEEINARDLNKFIYFLPEGDIIHDFLSSIDGFVSTSVSEGFSNVIVEAMAHQLPCAVTDVGDNAIIMSGSNFISNVNDYETFSINMLKIINLSTRELDITRSINYKIANLYSVETLVHKTEQLLKEV